MIEKRINPTKTEQELYEIKNLKKFIKQEQRKDELDRLYEVRQQKKVWHNVIFICGIFNLILISFAIWGYINNA